MKNKFSYYLFPVLMLTSIYNNCYADKSNRVYFKINPEDRKIVLPMQLNDSITANMAFDSGAVTGTLILDSTFCAKHPSVFFNHTPDTLVRSGSAWASKSFIATIHKFAPKANIVNTKLSFDYMRIYNWKQYNNNL